METSPIGAPAAQGSARAAARPEAPAPVASDFQTFLTLLTAQMRNQDPLKPIESTEFVAQLASFSAVEQQIRSNDRLDRIIEALSGGSSAGLAHWIGREVRAPVAANFQGLPVRVEVTPVPEADRAVLVVRNAFGETVARQPVEPGQTATTWEGLSSLGEPLPHGSYSFELESYAGEQLIGTTPGEVFSAVVEVRIVDGQARLVLSEGEQIELEAVSALR